MFEVEPGQARAADILICQATLADMLLGAISSVR
jgi:hypothetical protein